MLIIMMNYAVVMKTQNEGNMPKNVTQIDL